MTPSQHALLAEVFAAALEAPEGERDGVARRACAGDPVVLAEVLAMLAVDEGRLHGLERAANGVGARLIGALGADDGASAEVDGTSPRGLTIGTRLGSYTLLRALGEGGMGVVYLARQDSPRREVALKVMRPGVWSPQHLQRFRREAAVLARLHHAGIAQIYEAGVATLAGHAGEDVPQPYFAFEYVNGVRLDEYVRSKSLGVREILEVLALVADAIHSAHEQGVVHRDLKPSNILVDGAGQPKVLDFGVARAEAGPGVEQTIVTAAGQIVGTLPYMSPEQVSGVSADADRRADVYALGVIGYELFAQRLPLDVSQRSVAEAARLIREQEPTRLSSFDARLRGDIETIVGKAMEKDRNRRYLTAADLAADIRRYLGDEPIGARPQSTLYQLSKFTKRNRGLVAGISVAMAILLASTVALAVLYRDAVVAKNEAEEATAKTKIALDNTELARADARRSADVAERSADLYRQIFEGLDPNISSGRDTSLLKEMLDRSAVRISGDKAIEPAVAGVVLGAIGTAYQNIARMPEADTYLTGAYEKLLDALGERDAKTLNAMSSLAILRRAQSRMGEAEPLYIRTYELRREILGPEHVDTLRAQNNLAVLYWSTGRSRLAEPLLKDLLTIRERTLGPNAAATITTLANLANITMDLGGRQREAMVMFKAAYERTEVVQGPEHPQTMVRLSNYAIALTRSDRATESVPMLERVLAANAKSFEPNHPSVMRSKLNMAEAYQRVGRLDEAAALCLDVIAGRTATIGAAHGDTLYAMVQLTDVWLDQGRDTEAAWLLDAIFPAYFAMRTGAVGDAPVYFKRLAQIARRRGDGAAEVEWREASLEAMYAGYDPGHPARLQAAQQLADACLRAGRPADAERHALLALSQADAAWSTGSADAIDLLVVLASSLSAQQDHASADALFGLANAMGPRDDGDSPLRSSLRSAAVAYAEHLESVDRCDEAGRWRARAADTGLRR